MDFCFYCDKNVIILVFILSILFTYLNEVQTIDRGTNESQKGLFFLYTIWEH